MSRKRAFTDDENFEARPDEDAAEVDDGPSKSELKRQDLQLRELGVALVELPAAELEALDLPERLFDAVTACRTITAHGARLRLRTCRMTPFPVSLAVVRVVVACGDGAEGGGGLGSADLGGMLGGWVLGLLSSSGW